MEPTGRDTSTNATITPEEIADRLAIRELVDAYAHFADRREPQEQAALYADDGRTLVYTDPAASEPAQVLSGHAEHIAGFRTLSQYAATMHFNGQSSIALHGDRATARSYCLAHHLLDTEEGRTLLVLFIRYEDSFVKHAGTWRFAERKLADRVDGPPTLPPVDDPGVSRPVPASRRGSTSSPAIAVIVVVSRRCGSGPPAYR